MPPVQHKCTQQECIIKHEKYINELKIEVAVAKSDIAVVKGDIKDTMTDVKELRNEVKQGFEKSESKNSKVFWMIFSVMMGVILELVVNVLKK